MVMMRKGIYMRTTDEKYGQQLEPFIETENGMLFVFEIDSESEDDKVNGCLVVIMFAKSAGYLTRSGLGGGLAISEVFITVMYD